MRFDMKDLDIQMEDSLETFYHNGEKMNGIVFSQYNSFCSLEFEVKNGVKDGIEKEYLNNETLTKLTTWKDGMEEGVCKEYFDSGKLREEMLFRKGGLISSNLYDENGQLIKHYEIDGQ